MDLKAQNRILMTDMGLMLIIFIKLKTYYRTNIKEKYSLYLMPATNNVEDVLHIGYLTIDKLLHSNF